MGKAVISTSFWIHSCGIQLSPCSANCSGVAGGVQGGNPCVPRRCQGCPLRCGYQPQTGEPMSLSEDNDVLFFITPIGDDDSDIRKRSDSVLKNVIQEAAEKLNLQAVRADTITQSGEITAQVIEYLLNAKAAVADLTDLNPNVVYELAIRHAAKKPVVIIAEQCDLPFDLAQLRTIFFKHAVTEDAHRCRDGIIEQLGGALNGKDREHDNPVIRALDVLELRAGTGGAVERGIADLVASVEAIASEQRATSAMVQRIDRGLGRRPVPSHVIEDLTSGFSRLTELMADDASPELREAANQLWNPILFLANFESHVPRFPPNERRVVGGAQGRIELGGDPNSAG